MRILTAAEMREVDRLTTERYGILSLELMENAGRAVAEVLTGRVSNLGQKRIVVLCGKGNNGGDGFVAARYLQASGAAPEVILLAAPESVRGDAAINFKRWEEANGKLISVTNTSAWENSRAALWGADIVVDALLGTGLTGPPEGLVAAAIEDLNRAPRHPLVFAVDIPSGVSSDRVQPDWPAVVADFTVTFTAPKLGQVLPDNAGKIGRLIVREIGSPYELVAAGADTDLVWIEPREFAGLPLRRRATGHKGEYGHVLLVAGSRGKTGAAILAARGALRAGAGLATVATPEDVWPVVAAGMPELMTEPMIGTDAGTVAVANLDYGRLKTLVAGKSVVGIGPGISTERETQQFVRAAVSAIELPMILDADGLNAFAGCASEFKARRGSHLALTPHPGEMARLLGLGAQEVQAHRLDVARDAASRWNAVVVLKGHQTLVAAVGGRLYVNSTGNPGMGSGGTGDVLTGLLAGLTAQFGVQDWPRVLALGVYLHGLAGDLAAAQLGEESLLATDLVEQLPQAWRQLLRDTGNA